jgi:molecular chaperone DnaK
MGHPVRKAVITVPAYFSDAQRQATREAGEIAGLEPVRILNEPTAAALTYEAGQSEAKRVVVYDFGGGTFDVSVVRIQDGVVEVISSHGNNHLGGDDFDAKLVGHILDHLRIKHGVDLSGDLRAMAQITRAAEDAKKRLPVEPFCPVEEEYLTEDDGKPVNLSLEIDRHAYEEMIWPFVEETLDAVHIALKGADLTVSQVDEIMLVGGATRTPLIQRRLEETFGMAPRGEVDPDLCVALGAAIQGAAIAGEDVSAVLVDATPYSFGISAPGEMDGDFYPYCFQPIITKNTPIPVRRSERAIERPDLLPGDLSDGALPDLPGNPERRRNLPPLPGGTRLRPEDRAHGGRTADNGDAPARVRRTRNRRPPAEALAVAPSHSGDLDPSEAARAIGRRLRTGYCPAGKERKSWQKKGPRKTAARV